MTVDIPDSFSHSITATSERKFYRTLKKALYSEQYDTLLQFLRHGPPTICPKWSHLLKQACILNNISIAHLILSLLTLQTEENSSFAEKENMTSLMMLTARHGRLALLALILEQQETKVDEVVDQRTGRTLLMESVLHRQQQCVRYLVSRGADPLLTDLHQESALSYAVSTHQPQLVSFFQKHLEEGHNVKDCEGGLKPRRRLSEAMLKLSRSLTTSYPLSKNLNMPSLNPNRFSVNPSSTHSFSPNNTSTNPLSTISTYACITRNYIHLGDILQMERPKPVGRLDRGDLVHIILLANNGWAYGSRLHLALHPQKPSSEEGVWFPTDHCRLYECDHVYAQLRQQQGKKAQGPAVPPRSSSLVTETEEVLEESKVIPKVVTTNKGKLKDGEDFQEREQSLIHFIQSSLSLDALSGSVTIN